MLIQIELTEVEEYELEKCKDIIGSTTKRSCIRSIIYLFPLLSNKYEKLRSENKHKASEIKMYQNKLKKLA
tara:strand:+ start:370 stop:582 length:213 start_codon:yes stop_codon:yes gene_type:complete